MGAVGDAARPLSPFERLANNTLVRRLVILVVLGAALGGLCALASANPLLFPSFTDTLDAFWEAVVRGPLIERTLTSLQVLLMGYAASGSRSPPCSPRSRSRPASAPICCRR